MKKLIFVFLMILVINEHASAQCSDAGICSLGGNSHEQKTDHVISVLYSYGTSGKSDDLKFNSVKISAALQVIEKVDLLLSLPYNFISGPRGSLNGIGDLIINLKRSFETSFGSAIDISLGMKLATGKDNEKKLPQAYQSGLGTNDILIGIDYSIENFSFGAGYQISNGRSDNSIDRLKRGDDFLVRAGYTEKFEGELYVGAEVLLIKRLQKSSVLSAVNITSGPGFVDVEGSDQIQINMLGRVAKNLTESIRLEAIVALPFIKRNVNIDGLKRAFSLSLGASASF